jgi:hypothetical protein
MWYKKLSVWFIILYSILTISSDFILKQKNFISFDNFGYYMHLPAKYIYKDVELKTDWYKKINEQYNVTPTYFQVAKSKHGGDIMRFYKGMSYIWTPAFFTAHFYAKAAGYPADGFSAPYQWALIIFGGLWCVIGFIASRKILLRFFNEKITTLTLLVLLLGTNLLYFVSWGNDVPHAYLFTLFALVILYTLKWYDKPNYLNALILGVALGLILAIRPSDIFIGIIPVFYIYLFITRKENSLNARPDLIRKILPQIILAVVVMGLIMLPQFLYYKKYGGEYLLNIYSEAGASFDYFRPKFAHVLFSFRKGWFIYSPLSLLGIAGLIMTYKKYKEYFWPAVIYLFLLTYLVAAFNSLVSYGWRAFIESYAVLIIPTGFFIQYLSKQKLLVRTVAWVLISLLTILNLHQTWQVKWAIIDGSRMTKEYYFRILGKNSVTEEDKKLLLIERSLTAVDEMPADIKFNNRILHQNSFDDISITDSLAPKPFSGTGMFELNPDAIYSPDFRIAYKRLTDEYYCYVKSSIMVYSDQPLNDEVLIVITTLNNSGNHIKYRALGKPEKEFVPGQWNKISLIYQTPEIFTGKEIVHTYVYYTGKNKVWIDNFEVLAYTLD